MARNWHLCDPIRHPGGTYVTRSRHLDVWLANSGSAPWKHHGTTQRARIWHRYVTLIGHCRWRGCVFTMTAPCGHLNGTIATRWQHVFGTAIAQCLDAKSHKEHLSPTPFVPFFVLAGQAQRMGPLGQISGEIGHGGSWGQSRAFLRPKRRLLLRPLAALPPRAVLWPETMALPWHQPSHAELRIPQIVRIYPSIASDSQESTQS